MDRYFHCTQQLQPSFEEIMIKTCHAIYTPYEVRCRNVATNGKSTIGKLR